MEPNHTPSGIETLPDSPGIYAITNVLTGRSYIGRSKSIRHRWAEHLKVLRGRKHHSYRLQEAWDEHGPDVFRCDVVEFVPGGLGAEQRREQWWLDSLRPAYNVSPWSTYAAPQSAKKTITPTRGDVYGPATLWHSLPIVSVAERENGIRKIGRDADEQRYAFIIGGETWKAEKELRQAGCVWRQGSRTWRARAVLAPDWLITLPDRYPGVSVSQMLQ